MSTPSKEVLRVETLDGKYTVILTDCGRLRALRHGQGWRDCIGDNLVLTLAQDCETLRERAEKAEAERDENYEKALAAVYLIPDDVLCGELRKLRDGHKERIKKLEAELTEMKESLTEVIFRRGQLEADNARLRAALEETKTELVFWCTEPNQHTHDVLTRATKALNGGPTP